MKRAHMIERLVAVGYSERVLFGTNENIRAIYAASQARFKAKVRKARRERRQQEELRAMLRSVEAQRAWSKNWKHPRVVAPLEAQKPILDFGLADLWNTAAWLVRHQGDQDAAATLRVIGPLPRRFITGPRAMAVVRRTMVHPVTA